MVSENSLFYGFRGLRWLGKPYCSEESLPWWKVVTDILVVSVITLLSISNYLEEWVKDEKISSFVTVLGIVGNNFLASNLILLNLRRNHPLLPVVKSICLLPFSQHACNHIGWLLVGFIFVLANLLTDFLVFPVLIVGKIFPVYYLSDVLIYLFLAQFVIPLLMIGDRLSNISLSLRCLGKRDAFELMPQFNELLRIHRQLINLCTKMKHIYSWPLLVIVASKLFGATASVYRSVSIFFDLVKSMASYEYFSAFIGAANEIYVIWCVIHPAWIIAEKIKQINGDLYTLCMNEDSHSLVQNELLTSFLEQRISISFSAYGLFQLDHSLLRSIFATIASYLFIIIQFQIRSNLEEKGVHRTMKNSSSSRNL